MILRRVPGALALGLLASLAAHTALYGHEHAMAGGYHRQLVLTAIVGLLGFLVGFGALAWSARRGPAQGSILASRLSERLPGFGLVLAAAALWFSLAEAVEPSHASVPPLITLLCLCVAAWAVGLLARAAVAAFAGIVIAISRLAFSPRTPHWTRHPVSRFVRRDVLYGRRRFARPPPVVSLHRALPRVLRTRPHRRNLMSRVFAAVIAALIAFSYAAPALAAVSGLVRGTVTVDSKPIKGVTVTLQGEGSKFTAKTSSAGEFVFPEVPFGTYRLSASVQGAAPLEVSVEVTSGQVATVDLPLSTHLKEIARTTVTAHAGLASYPASVHQIDRAQIQTSPVQNSLDQTIATLPGVIPFSYNEPVINGFHGVAYNIDGAPLPLATTSNFAEIVDPRIIDSLEVYTGAIPAEYGGDRMGGVVNILTNRPTDVPPGFYATATGGFGNQSQALGQFDSSARFGSSEAFLDLNTQSTARGLDAPTFASIHNNSSQSDQFFRFITQLSPRSSLAFDYSNQLAQFQIPINTDPNNPFDPITTPAGTDDVQREYDRFSNLNYTQQSRDGNGIFQVIPWWRSTRIDYDGDLFNDVLGLTPDFGSDVVPQDGSGSGQLHNVGLLSNTYASYVGVRASDFRATANHAWKIGVDLNRENLAASQAFACYFAEGCGATSGTHDQPYYLIAPPSQAQAGSQIGIYGQDNWKLSNNAELDYGLRYDHSTGYTSGFMFSPRVNLKLWDGGKNTYHMYYGRFYAAPLLEDVRQDCVLLQGCTGEPVYDLKPEQDSYYETGWEHTFYPGLTGSINVFRRTAVNILDTTQLLNTPLFAVFNNAIGIDTGAELRFQGKVVNGDSWWYNLTYSGSYAACVSGATFLFPPNTNEPGVSCVAQLAPEDHDETVVSSAAYTWRFGAGRRWFTTLQGNYGSGFPVAFESANTALSGRLPAHTTFDLAAGRTLVAGHAGQDTGLAVQLIVTNILNHQYPIKVANGFNTTQVSNGTSFLFQVSAPFQHQ